ncbi:hypothetical protein ACLQ2Q_18680 [Microbacterium sp. DT81.1]|uniref:hypothetical protein n=1 Tax=Microbacterium sp. DT81.1 TaxID=3393413 RepID=UPI003CECD4B4
MSNTHDAASRDTEAPDAEARDTAPLDPVTPTAGAPAVGTPTDQGAPPQAPPRTEKKVSRGWLIGAVAAGGALLLALVFGGGVATGLGVGALTRGGFAADEGGGPGAPGEGGFHRWGPDAGPGPGRPGDGDRRDGQDRQDDTTTPSPTPTPGA